MLDIDPQMGQSVLSFVADDEVIDRVVAHRAGS
jgi:hypothetical protein